MIVKIDSCRPIQGSFVCFYELHNHCRIFRINLLDVTKWMAVEVPPDILEALQLAMLETFGLPTQQCQQF